MLQKILNKTNTPEWYKYKNSSYTESFTPSTYPDKNPSSLQDNPQQNKHSEQLTVILYCHQKIHLPHNQCYGRLFPPK